MNIDLDAQTNFENQIVKAITELRRSEPNRVVKLSDIIGKVRTSEYGGTERERQYDKALQRLQKRGVIKFDIAMCGDKNKHTWQVVSCDCDYCRAERGQEPLRWAPSYGRNLHKPVSAERQAQADEYVRQCLQEVERRSHTEDCRWLEYGECECTGKPEGEGCG